MMDPKLTQLFTIKAGLESQVKAITSTRLEGDQDKLDRRTIFHDLLESESLPQEEKTLRRLTEEAQIIASAGSVTTAHYLKCTIYHIIANESIYRRLKAELEAAIPDSMVVPPSHALGRLPYFAAVVKEGFRINDGASSRLVRVAPDIDLRCGDHVIPKVTSISMSTWLQHRDPTLFPKGDTFDPERWLGPDTAKLERYLVNFSKGTRNCLGLNLAKAEIYMTLAAIFRRFELELFETDRSMWTWRMTSSCHTQG
ncbi:hypothetical protein LTR56_002010 [Elasticomyces elasticus]|nr:hypothetical protein LTR22_022251 [Elasticomyces elasticus]KAK3658154.1 hypothetical protein LTR56_002010 [Elasticomyces elasticus]KAK4907286.1 hypothetical protein LTR49_023700 [Elasticomyces elasticus]KAK5764039.1 hypothetical protein LTS12_005732 [Elasticomyces elasticus]